MGNALYDIRLRDADGRRVGGGEGQRDRICKAREDRTPFLAENKKNEIAVYRFNRKRLGRRPEPQQADIFAKRKLSTPGPVPIWQIQSGEYYVIDSPRFPALPHFRIR